MSDSDAFRKDIEGLRGVAVLLVVLFHIDENWIPGGFVGVDIFFVISGYLITGIVARQQAQATFSLRDFYARRIRRIFPAMFTVTLATLVAGVLLLTPDDLVSLSWSAFATAFSFANVYFALFLDVSYFAPDSAAVPLLHMWSLGVEEQFYLLWPAILIALLAKPKLIWPAIVAIIVASIAVGEWQLRNGQLSWAYYLLPARTFQLLAGGGAYLLARRFSLTTAPATIASAVGLLLLLGSATWLSGQDPFPGLAAVPVTIGTIALLIAGASQNAISKILGNRALRWFGLISYSLYLWHWPILAYQRYYVAELDVVQKLASAVAMLVLAYGTYRWVERPFRAREAPFGRLVATYFVLPALAVAVVGGAMVASAGLGPWLWSPSAAELQTRNVAAAEFDFVCQAPRISAEMIKNPKCVLGSSTSPTVLLYGDSNSAHFVGAFRTVAEAEGFQFRNVAHSACPPVRREVRAFVASRYAERCLASQEAVDRIVSDYDTIILAASWSNYDDKGGAAFRESITSYVKQLVASGLNVVLVGVIPRQPNFDRQCSLKRTKMPLLTCSEAQNVPEHAINQFLKSLSDQTGVYFLNPRMALCDGPTCVTYRNSQLLYFDAGHLSLAGSEAVGEFWLQDPDSLRVLERIAGGG